MQFDIDYEEFKQSIEGLKQQLQMFVDSWFEKPLSVSIYFTKLPCFLLLTVLCGQHNVYILEFWLPRFSFV